MIKSSSSCQELQEVRDTFRSYDDNRDDYWDIKDLRDFIYQQGTGESAEEIMKDADVDKDSQISFRELCQWYERQEMVAAGTD
ncbi:hypothetical protein CHS0354_014854 [Potamilus streckersoni]|uniref:EF-hand domain-containing protein n=1 Tax=Potamilus streckersoni TaxID=2493646 RepID=A0AAE0RM83_9BIVA|nr:hypothetical protein CHS0354_014854 [Potamilus streckersoni]